MKELSIKYKGTTYTAKVLAELTGYSIRSATIWMPLIKKGELTIEECMEKKKNHRASTVFCRHKGEKYTPADIEEITGLAYCAAIQRINKFNKQEMCFEELMKKSQRSKKRSNAEQMTPQQRALLEEFKQSAERSEDLYQKYYEKGHFLIK